MVILHLMDDTKNDTAGSRFSEALAFAGKRPVDVADALGVDPQLVNNWKERGVSKSNNDQAAKYLGVDPGWLATGHGEMFDDKQQQRDEFAARLNELCDEAGLRPKYEGRQVDLSRIFGVTQNGARKWLEGEALPRLTKASEIALHFGVHTEWLLTGKEPKRLGDAAPTAPRPLNAEANELLKLFERLPPKNRKAFLDMLRSTVDALTPIQSDQQ